VLLFGSIDLFITVNPSSERSCQLCILSKNFNCSQFLVENPTVTDIALEKKKLASWIGRLNLGSLPCCYFSIHIR
jgi:hypothetical protein